MNKIIRLMLIFALIFGLNAPVTAQSSYNSKCQPVEKSQDEQTLEETEKLHPVISAGYRLAAKACRGINYLKKLFSKESDPDKIDADMVFEASKPEMDPVKVRQEYLKEERKAEQRMKDREERKRDEYLRSNPANDAAKERNERADEEGMLARMREPLVPFPIPAPEPVIMPPKKEGGFIQIFQGKVTPVDAKGTLPQTPEQLNGEGTFIGEDGIESGTFEGGELEGGGQEITPDGAWRGGNYHDGEIEGAGFEVGMRDGQVYYMDGNFVDDRPDGSVTMSYTDGTSQRVLWKNGEPVAYGQMAALGAIPAEPVYKSPQQLAAEADAAFDAKLASAPSGGALYAIADELEEQGDSAKARRAYRALMTRFPDSPLADRAAGKLDGDGGKSSSSSTNGTTSSGNSSVGSTGNGTAAAPGPQVIYGVLVPQPMLWQSFYTRMNRMSAAECKPSGMDNDSETLELLRLMNQANTGALQDQMRAIAGVHEASLLAAIRCNQGNAVIEQARSARQQTLQTCEQTSSNPAYCHQALK